ncbi:MAG TPA: TolC family protein [Fimbriiglobus sp.]|jgi:cobalt-zinc-cadmium efflux system outer membrane protein|nr:TolC family protein [Fimbriiglobus sp.]
MFRATPIRAVIRGLLVAGGTGGVAFLAAGQPPAAPRLATPPAPVPAVPAPPTGVDDFVRLALERNPRLGRAAFAIDAARGRFVQAGLYPNPVLSITGDELGDRQGPGGIWTAPQVNQELVTGRKLTLSQAVAAREVDRAALDLLTERYALVGAVRAGFYEVYALQRRAEILADLVKLAGQSVELGQKQLALKQVARLDVIQLEVELERFRAEFESVERELPAAYRRLAAVAGDPRLPVWPLAGTFDAPLPDYDPEKTRETVLAVHPEVRAARVAIERAQFALRRAQAEPIPNVTLSSGYVRQNQNRSDDWMIGVSMPIPLWNRNQGNIRAAQAEIGIAVQDVGRVENDLAERLATAFRTYGSARQRAERYKTSLLPRAEETYELSLKAFKGGQFEYLRVLQAQRAVAEARLEYNRALGEAWRAAGEISGLLLEEVWPLPPAPAAPVVVPPAAPAQLPPSPKP